MRSCVNRQLCPVTLEVVSSVLTAVHKMGHPDRCPARLGRKSILDQTSNVPQVCSSFCFEILYCPTSLRYLAMLLDVFCMVFRNLLLRFQ